VIADRDPRNIQQAATLHASARNPGAGRQASARRAMELLATCAGKPTQACAASGLLQFATRIMAAVNAGERNLERLTPFALGEDADQVDTTDPASAPIAEEPFPAT